MQYQLIALIALTTITLPINAYQLTPGGFIKVDAKIATGTLPFKSIVDGNPGTPKSNHSQTQFNAQESRFNLNYEHEDIRGFAEIDFVGSQQGNTLVSNSYSPRLRHAFIEYRDIILGQTWSTLVNTSAFPESANLGGPLVGEAMVRQTQARLVLGPWQLALENPALLTRNNDSHITEKPESALPDFIVKYNWQNTSGNLSIAGLGRSLSATPDSHTAAFGISIAGQLKTTITDDIRFQLHYGNLGRYIGTAAAADVFNGQVEHTFGGMLALRHFWADKTRSSFYMGYLASQEEGNRRGHMAINLFHDPHPYLTLGVELGHYMVRDKSNSLRDAYHGDSSYLHFSALLKF